METKFRKNCELLVYAADGAFCLVKNSPLVLTSHLKLACSPSFLVRIFSVLPVLSVWSQRTMLLSRMRTIGILVIW